MSQQGKPAAALLQRDESTHAKLDVNSAIPAQCLISRALGQLRSSDTYVDAGFGIDAANDS